MPKFRSKEEYDAWKKQLNADLQSTSPGSDKQCNESTTSSTQTAINQFEQATNPSLEKNKQCAIFISPAASDSPLYVKKLVNRRVLGAILFIFVIILFSMILRASYRYSVDMANEQSTTTHLKKQENQEIRKNISNMDIDQIKSEVSDTFAIILRLWLEDNFNEIYSNYGGAESKKSVPNFVSAMENGDLSFICCLDSMNGIGFQINNYDRTVTVFPKLHFNKKGVPFSDFIPANNLTFTLEDKWRINLVDLMLTAHAL